MRTILDQAAGRSDVALSRLSRILRLTTVLGGLLLFALLQNPAQAAQSVELSWTPSSDPTVVGYHTYYGVASRSYTNITDVGAATSVAIPGLVSGATYYFAATSYNILGLESDYSAEVAYTVPAATPSLLQILVPSPGQVVVTVTGTVGHTYQIQATQDLKSWSVIGTVTVGAGGSGSFTDTNAVMFSRRFYRTQG
jgi:hypothetical protein